MKAKIEIHNRKRLNPARGFPLPSIPFMYVPGGGGGRIKKEKKLL